MNKKSILCHKEEFIKIFNSIEPDGTFTSVSSNVNCHTLKLMLRKKLIKLKGFDKKRRINIYTIPLHQTNMI
jgi:hypothetical protein